MKNLLIIAIMLTIVTGYAEVINDSDTGNRMTTFEFSNVKEGHQLIIKDDQGVVWYREAIESNGRYLKNFDLTALKDGYYTIELNKDFEIIIKPFKIDSNAVIFLTNEDTKVFKPLVRLENNQLLVSQLVLNEEPLKVELYYNDDIIYKEQISGEKVLERVYSLSKTEKGYYHIVITSGGRKFSKSYNL